MVVNVKQMLTTTNCSEIEEKMCDDVYVFESVKLCFEIQDPWWHRIDKVGNGKNSFPTKCLETAMVNIRDLATSRRCLFFLLAIPFCFSVSIQELWCTIL